MTDVQEYTISTEKISKIDRDFSSSLTPEDIESLSSEYRKLLRSELYQFPSESLNFEGYNNEIYKPENIFLYFDESSNQDKGGRYKGVLQWDFEKLENSDLKGLINIERLKYLLTIKNNISYEKFEALFNGDPKFLLTSMSLISNNYISFLNKYDEEQSRNKEIDDIDFIKLGFLFTESEEKLFLVSRTLIKTLIENTPEKDQDYMSNVIKDIDSIIYRFNTGLIAKVAGKYQKFLSFDNFFQQSASNFKIILDKFDIDRGLRFSTYSYWWLRKDVIDYYKDNLSLIKIPKYLVDDLTRFRKAEFKLKKILRRKPNFDETWDYCQDQNISLPVFKKTLLKAYKASSVMSYNKSNLYNNDFEEFEPLLNSLKTESSITPESAMINLNKEYVEALFQRAKLNPRDERIVRMKYKLIPNENKRNSDYSNNEIAKKFGLSKDDVRSILNRSLKRLYEVA